MRSVLRLAGTACAVAALLCVAGSFFAFRAAMSAKSSRALAEQAESARPLAAARLAVALLERRLSADAAGAGSTAVSAAFQKNSGAAALEAYRQAGGDPGICAEAQKALPAAGAPDEVAFLRAVRLLRAEAGPARLLPPPEAPPSFATGARLLLAAGAACLAAALCCLAAGRA